MTRRGIDPRYGRTEPDAEGVPVLLIVRWRERHLVLEATGVQVCAGSGSDMAVERGLEKLSIATVKAIKRFARMPPRALCSVCIAAMTWFVPANDIVESATEYRRRGQAEQQQQHEKAVTL